MANVSPVLALLKLLVDTICLQHIFPIWLRHGLQCPVFDTFLIIFWLFNSLFPPIRSFKFLFRLNVMIGLSANIFPNLLFVDKMFQLSWMTLRTSERFRLYFVVNLIVLSTLLSLYTIRSLYIYIYIYMNYEKFIHISNSIFLYISMFHHQD